MESINVTNYSNSAGILRQFFASTVATIGVFGLGTVLAYTSPAIPSLESEHIFGSHKNDTSTWNLSVEVRSWIGSIAMLGALVAASLAGIAVNAIGRRQSMYIFAVPFIIGWLLIGFSSSHLWLFLTGRFLTGFGGGAFSLLGPVYISEISDTKIRGTLLSLFQLMLVTGILFTYGMGILLNWKDLALLSGGIPCLLFVLLPFIPESPRYFVQNEKYEDAKKSLQFLWGFKVGTLPNNDIEDELLAMQRSVLESRTDQTKFTDLFQPKLLKPIAVCLSLMVFEQISGYNAIIFYAARIFKEAGSSMDASVSSITVGVVQVVATVGSSIMVDRAGRRILLLFPQILMGFSLVALGIYFYLNEYYLVQSPYFPSIKWIPLFCMIVFIIAFSIGIGPLSWTMMGELLPPNIKGSCSSVAASLVWLCAFFVTKSFDNVANALGIYWCFWIYGICCFIGFFSIYFTVPETKGKSLEEIQKVFQK